MKTQSTRHPSVRFGGLLAASLLLALALSPPAQAQDDAPRAGLVVQFGDGSVFTACVDLGADGQATGEEVVRAAGLYTIVDYGSGFGGGTVCKLNSQGCDFPAEACFCQCTMKPGTDCIYWTYFHQRDGQWRYAIEGVSRHILQKGDVDGWAWGLGTTTTGVQPPLIPFEQICSAASDAPPPPLPTEPVLPTATPPPPPTHTATPNPPTATPQPTPSPSPTGTATPVVVSPSPQPTEEVTDTPAPSPTPSTTATLRAEPQGKAATLTATPQPVASVNEQVDAHPTATRPPTITPFTPEPAPSAASAGNYAVFGALIVALTGGLVVMWLRQRP